MIIIMKNIIFTVSTASYLSSICGVIVEHDRKNAGGTEIVSSAYAGK